MTTAAATRTPSAPSPFSDVYRFGHAACAVRLHRGQVEMLRARSREKVVCCGRRWGKTTAVAVDVLFWGFGHPESQQWVVAPTYDQAATMFEMVDRFIGEGPLAQLVRVRKAPFYQVTLPNGALVHFRSAGSDGKYLRGKHADRVILDEAAFQPRAVVEEVVPKMMATSAYGEMVMISTPWGKNHFWEAHRRGTQRMDERSMAFHYPTWSSPHVNMRTLAEEFGRYSKLAWDVEYAAVFRAAQNALFPDTVIDAAIDDALDCPAPSLAGHRYVGGFDPAKWRDRSAVIVLDITDLPWRVVEVRDLHGRDFTAQAALVREISQRYNDCPFVADATSNEGAFELVAATGVSVYPFKFTAVNKWPLLSAYAAELEQHRVLIPRHPDLIREHQYYEMIPTPTSVKLGAPDRPDAYDDYVTASALATQLAKDLTMAAGSWNVTHLGR